MAPERRPPRRFRRIVEKLVDVGHVDRRTDGIHDSYSPSEPGDRALEAHFEWASGRTGP